MPWTSDDAITQLVKLRGKRIRFRVGRDGWITNEDDYEAEIEGNLRYVRPDCHADRGMHPTLCLIQCCYRRLTDPPDKFGEKMNGVMEYRVMAADAQHVHLAPIRK